MNDKTVYFVTGTDTEIGKTVSTSVLIRSFVDAGLKVAGLKPIASGFELRGDDWLNEDIESLTASSNVSLPPEIVNVYAFSEPVAPHIGADEANISICLDTIVQAVELAKRQADVLFVEGVGGWRVPLSGRDKSQEDTVLARGDVSTLAKKLDVPVILVVGMRLGCINQAVLTAEQIVNDGMNLVGWVANSTAPTMECYQQNLSTLSQLIPAPLLFELPYFADDAQRQSYVVEVYPKLLAV